MDFCTRLSINLLIDALKTNDETNLVFSPMSYNVILNMIAGGASEYTLMEMFDCAGIIDVNSNSKKMVSLASESDGDENYGCEPVVHCLNGIWLNQGYVLKPSYEELASKIYKARVKIADFTNKADEVVEDANAWAKESTRGLVTDVLEEGELDGASFVLGNALYFKGFWTSGFEPESTWNRPFYLMNGKKKSVPFMTGCRIYSHGSFDGFEVVKIPYKRGENRKLFSMYFFLPNNRFGLDDMLHKVASDEDFLRRDFNLPEEASYESFWIPKFKFSYYTSEGVEGMKQMGLNLPFDKSVVGGLTEMVNGRISVSKIVQKSFIEIDEKGTEAAAVTFAGDEEECNEYECEEFVADHPFLFMIREEKSKFILFTGVVLDPSTQ